MMKPLFDSDEFAFIGSAENVLSVWCRSCNAEADAEVQTEPPGLDIVCNHCGRTRQYVIHKPDATSASAPGSA